jgi:hypothetical protein
MCNAVCIICFSFLGLYAQLCLGAYEWPSLYFPCAASNMLERKAVPYIDILMLMNLIFLFPLKFYQKDVTIETQHSDLQNACSSFLNGHLQSLYIYIYIYIYSS